MIISFDRWTSQSRDQLPINTILYAAVINTPSRIESDMIRGSWLKLLLLLKIDSYGIF